MQIRRTHKTVVGFKINQRPLNFMQLEQKKKHYLKGINIKRNESKINAVEHLLNKEWKWKSETSLTLLRHRQSLMSRAEL